MSSLYSVWQCNVWPRHSGCEILNRTVLYRSISKIFSRWSWPIPTRMATLPEWFCFEIQFEKIHSVDFRWELDAPMPYFIARSFICMLTSHILLLHIIYCTLYSWEMLQYQSTWLNEWIANNIRWREFIYWINDLLYILNEYIKIMLFSLLRDILTHVMSSYVDGNLPHLASGRHAYFAMKKVFRLRIMDCNLFQFIPIQLHFQRF